MTNIALVCYICHSTLTSSCIFHTNWRQCFKQYILILIDSNNNVSKECGLTLKVRRFTIVGLLLCDIMTEPTLTPKIKPLYVVITLHLFLYLKAVPCQLRTGFLCCIVLNKEQTDNERICSIQNGRNM